MSTHKKFDLICVIVMVFALVLTVLFMNGEKLGITKIVDEDSEAVEETLTSYYTANDIDGDWDTSGATEITLNDSDTKISGDGAYMLEGNLIIAQSGKYVITGSLSNGTISVEANKNSKIWILFDNVTLNCDDNAAFMVCEADKVFLTLAEGSVNSITTGSSYSTDAVGLGAGGAIFAKDDLTINGSGSLDIVTEYKHGIDANDDLKITGGTITISCPQDGIHVNDDTTLYDTSVTIAAGDDGIHSGENIYIDSANIYVSECYEGIEAKYITMYSGDVTLYPSDDGFNATDGSSTDMFGFGGGGGGGMPGGGGLHGGDADGSSSDNADMATPDASSMPSMPADGEMPSMPDGMEMPTDGEIPDMSSMTDGGQMPDMSSMTDGEMPQMPDDIEMPTDGEAPSMPEDMEATSDMPSPADMEANADMPSPSDMEAPADMASEDAAETSEEDSEEEEDPIPFVKIYDGNVTIINPSATDADGIDSNGDIYIYGGNILVSLVNSGSNNALDYGSENGGVCEIDGGTVIACGGYSMAEAPEETSEQVSIMYTISSGIEAGETISVLDSDGNTVLTGVVPCSFSCAILSSPELQIGNTYTIVIGEDSEEITIDEISAAFGDAQSTMFGGSMNWGGFGGHGGGHGGHGGGGGGGKPSGSGMSSGDDKTSSSDK